jgi:formylglycine-generating enzyme required for sulfatase activity
MKYKCLLTAFACTLGASLVWASTQIFRQYVERFQEEAVKTFATYVMKDERYPLQHALYDMRFRVFQEELGISQRRETMECNRRRNFGTEITEAKQEFCQTYDFIIDLAKEQLSTVSVFKLVYSTVEPILLREIETRKARDIFRVWIHQKLNCLEDDYRCANNEREMLRRITKGKQAVLNAYHAALVRLEKKLYPDEITTAPVWSYAGQACKIIGSSPHGEERIGMVFIPGGVFRMGSPDGDSSEKPAREIRLTGYWLDRCEVSNADYLNFVMRDPFLRRSSLPSTLHDGSYLRTWKDDLIVEYNVGSHPVTYVSWYAARYYCGALGKRLPSEAEWERAARDDKQNQSYSYGNDPVFLADYAWYRQNSATMQRVVADRKPSDLGVFDMHGNAWEWVYDRFGPYNQEELEDPTGPLKGEYRVMRGGSRLSPREYLRSGMRRDASPQSTWMDVGFRCATSAEFATVSTDINN